MENKLNVQKLGYEVGEPMWVHWDNRYVLRGGHILGKCPDENLITTVMCNLTGEPLQANVLEHIEDIILNIKDHYETFAVVPRGKSKLQVYMTISNGTNGAEGCIINSMEDVLNVLKNLRKYKGVNWSQLLEVGIDNADDLYWWYVTFSIDTTAV